MTHFISIKWHCPSPGTKATVHSKPSNRHTRESHGLYGWYVSQAPEHYQCYKVYINNTRSDRIANTVDFLPTQVNIPETSSADQATYAALKLVNALRNTSPEAPFVTFGYAQLSILHQISELFQTSEPVSLMPTSPTPQVTMPLPKVPIMSPQQVHYPRVI